MATDVGQVMEQLAAARAALRVVVEGAALVQSVDLGELTGAVSALAREAAGARVALAGEAQSRGLPGDVGARDVVTWLAGVDPVLPVAEARLVRKVVEVTDPAPLRPVREAVEQGVVGVRDAVDAARFVETMRPVVCARPAAGKDLGPVEQAARVDALVGDALMLYRAGCTRKEVRRLEVELMARYAPDRLAVEESATADRASMSAFVRRVDGMFEAGVVLDEASMLVVRAAIDALAAPAPAIDGTVDPRPVGRRRADALVTLALGAAGMDQRGPMGATTRVLVTMPLRQLADLAVTGGLISPDDATTCLTAAGSRAAGCRGPGRSVTEVSGDGMAITVAGSAGSGATGGASVGIPGDAAVSGAVVGDAVVGDDGSWRGANDAPGGVATGATITGEVITPAALRAMVCDAEIVPIVLDTHSQPLDVGRRARLATAGQRDALAIRDRGCTFPGCTAPPGWTRAHHITHWADGGATTDTNLTLLCAYHHRYVHHHDITGSVTGGGMQWDVERVNGRWLPVRRGAAA